jgi:DNA-binding GntR family transcriptional regulator
MTTSEPVSDHPAAAPEGKSTSLTDRVYESVRASILSGEYPVGSVLAEGTLAETFGSSKTPVRHALARLRTDGLLEVGRRRQLLVRGFTAEHREEVLQIREALEIIAIRKACSVMTVDDMDQMRVLLRRQRRAAVAQDEEEFLRIDEEFHVLVARGANLPIVARLLQQMRGFARIMRLGRTQPPEHLLEVQAEHEEIADALEARDSDLAERALHAHLHHWDAMLSASPAPRRS